MVHHSRCPLCGSEKIRIRFGCKDHLVSGEMFDIVECVTCGFLFTQDYPEENEISRYYESDDYISHSDTSSGLTGIMYRAIRKMMLRRKRALIKSVTGIKSGTLLDVGAGTGHFASVMKDDGWDVKGVEVNEKARKFALEKFELELFTADRIPSLERQNYDCITLWHVLEHFHDPGNYLKSLKPLLRPGGLMVIALPNSSSFDAKYYGASWAAFDVPRHLWHFNPVTFEDFMSRTGMKVEKLYNLPFDVFYISILSEDHRNSRLHFPSGIIKGLWFTLCSFFIEGKNSSIIYIVKAGDAQ